MANAPTKTKLHDQLEEIILNTRGLIDEKVQAKAITKTKADQLRSEFQKKIAAALTDLDERIVEELLQPEITNVECFSEANVDDSDLVMPEEDYQDLLRHGVLQYEAN